MNTVLQKNIKQQLEKQKLSIAELERRIGLRHAVVNILHGRSKNPSIHIAHAIAKELGFSVESMLTDGGDMDAVTASQVPAITAPKTTSAVWDPTIGMAALTAVNEYINTHNITPDNNQVFKCVNEIYSYTIGSVDKRIDYRFVQWLCERSFSAG